MNPKPIRGFNLRHAFPILLIFIVFAGQAQPAAVTNNSSAANPLALSSDVAFAQWAAMSSPELLRAAEAGNAHAQYFYWFGQEKEAFNEADRLYQEIHVLDHRLKGDEQEWAEATWGTNAQAVLRNVPKYADNAAQMSLDRQRVDQAFQRAVKAFAWLEKSASQGFPMAEYDCALRYLGLTGGSLFKIDEAKGLSFLQQAADHGWAAAQYRLGESCLAGELLRRDVAKALEYLQKAADQGGPNSQYALAQLYANGEGVPRSEADSPVALLRKSAASGNHLALQALADRYRAGLGVPVDYVRSIRLNQAAHEADQENRPSSPWSRTDVYQFVDSNLQPKPGFNADFMNFTKVVSVYLKATQRHDPVAMCQIGYWYLAGRFVPKDMVEAFRWFKFAADSGSPEARKRRDEIKTKLSPSQLEQALKPLGTNASPF